ncbi:MAG: secretion system protein E [Thermoplasmata archaeon HGW-Thermoplasmata-1]|nr:MAG: secretion system protein E [Thermoplasmata archaeon HGW-Thermoplasmata-1]
MAARPRKNLRKRPKRIHGIKAEAKPKIESKAEYPRWGAVDEPVGNEPALEAVPDTEPKTEYPRWGAVDEPVGNKAKFDATPETESKTEYPRWGAVDEPDATEAEKDPNIIESYEIENLMSGINIRLDTVKQEHAYEVVEPKLTETEEETLRFVKETLVMTLDMDLEGLERKEAYLEELFERIMKNYELKIDDPKKILYYLKRDFLGYGPIDVFMKDGLLEDISCNGNGVPIYVFHKNYEGMRTNVVFDEMELDSFVIKLAQKCGKHISIADPMLDASFPDGSRLQATYSKEITAGGSSFTIRKFREIPFTPLDLVKYGTFSAKIAAFYWLMVENGKNMVIAGGTASGKTTTTNAVSLFIPPTSKIVTIEDTREISLPHENWIKSITRLGMGGEVASGGGKGGEIDMYELLKAALRQRPEYIIVGEIRGKEAMVAFQAMTTGHIVYTTVHAESTATVIHRLESQPINIPRMLIQAMDVVSVQAQVKTGGKKQRRIIEITEVLGMDPETKEMRINSVFRYDEAGGYVYSGRSYMIERIAQSKGMTIRAMENEWNDRAGVIEWFIEQGVDNYVDFANAIVKYYKNKESVMREVKNSRRIGHSG